MDNINNVEVKKVDSQVLKDILEGGPGFIKRHLEVFSKDVGTLMMSASNLYDEDPVLSVLGVTVECKIIVDNKPITAISFGSSKLMNKQEKDEWIKKNAQHSEKQEPGMN